MVLGNMKAVAEAGGQIEWGSASGLTVWDAKGDPIQLDWDSGVPELREGQKLTFNRVIYLLLTFFLNTPYPLSFYKNLVC